MHRIQSIKTPRDILLDLQHENTSLYIQASQAKLLFSALQSLLALDDGNDPFQIVFAALRDVFDFEIASALVSRRMTPSTTSPPPRTNSWIRAGKRRDSCARSWGDG